MHKITDDEIITLLKENRFKATPQRLAICRFVLESHDHPSAEQIYTTIRKDYPTISLATVYKTLGLLDTIGLISELRFNATHTRYDPKMSLHINIICPKCLNIDDFESNSLNKTWQAIISDIEGEILGQRIDVYKLCKNCKK
ncbi:MAG: Transcriptional regulator PerR [Candidatus Heimdallarchaeota archaeon AB_125]|nr:MAG: Transcriptional regulator PerR [Candidatus Heimdallarchaeota archaeon AB_125]